VAQQNARTELSYGGLRVMTKQWWVFMEVLKEQ
jgi:hypothetical protein